MTHHPDEVIRYTREELLQVLADTLGSTAEDHRIIDAYDQVVSEWALHADDPEKEYTRFFRDGPVATEIDLAAARAWAGRRILL